MPNRLRRLLHRTIHIISDPRHGERQAAWRALHSAVGGQPLPDFRERPAPVGLQQSAPEQ